MAYREVKNSLAARYGRICMLTGVKSVMTFHHIRKKEHGGLATPQNGALLVKEAHAWLHKQEHYNRELYCLLNECLILYKLCRDKEMIEEIEIYENDVMPKIKRLVQLKSKKG